MAVKKRKQLKQELGEPPVRNILTETLITFEAAGNLVPPEGVHYTTIYRWASRGILQADGKTRIKLESIRVGGGQRLTSKESLTRFLIAASPQIEGVVTEADRERLTGQYMAGISHTAERTEIGQLASELAAMVSPDIVGEYTDSERDAVIGSLCILHHSLVYALKQQGWEGDIPDPIRESL